MPEKKQLWESLDEKSKSGIYKKIENFSIDVCLDKFLLYLQYERNISPKTLENYSLWLNRFVSYI